MQSKKGNMNMSETPFHTFIELIKVDQAIVDLGVLIEKLQSEISELNKHQDQQTLIVTTAQNNAHDARKAVDQFELELKALDQQEKQKKERLENSSDYKHYQSLKAEIDVLKHKQHQYEDILMTAWNKSEAMQKIYEDAQATYPTKTDDIKTVIKQKESEIATLKTSLDEYNSQRPAKEKVVPAEWLEKYAMMRSRVSDPVVPVQQGSCSACFYKIIEQDMLMLARRKLLQCKSCYRLLYSPELENSTLGNIHETT
jgi:predicted  nucleic acid-binding Zn-ribbon protein